MTLAFYRTSNQLAPVKAEGAPGDPIFGRQLLDFSVASEISFDLMQETVLNEIGFVQAMYIDNADNANPLTVFITPTQQRITVKGRTQGWYYALCGDPPVFKVMTTPAALCLVTIFFGNVPMAPVQWATQ